VTPTFEYCAARFLDLWIRQERSLYEAMQRPDDKAIRDVLAHFRVSRSFAGIAGAEIGIRIAALLKEHGKYITPKTAPLRVTSLAASPTFGSESQLNISAASKLLWMRWRTPFVIYDSRALRALQRDNGQLERGDYHAYYHVWRDAFEAAVPRLRVALQHLPRFVAFTALGEGGEREVRAMAHEEWFVEREVPSVFRLPTGPLSCRL
jgi:hypothetical protein